MGDLLVALGIDEGDEAKLGMVRDLAMRLLAKSVTRGRKLGRGSDVFAYFRAKLAQQPTEEFWVLALDVRHRVIGETMTGKGSLTGVDVHPRDVFRELIRQGAEAVIFCHNHPSGDPSPSRQDIELTARLREVGELCGIKVLDHVVVATEGYASIADRGWA
jgi:DNA repair protein RadC